MDMLVQPPEAVEPVEDHAPENLGRFDVASITPETMARLIERGHSKMKWRRDCQKDAYRRLLGREHGNGPAAVLKREDKNPWAGISDDANIVNLTVQHVRTLLVAVAYTAGEPDVSAKYTQFEPEAEMHKTALRIAFERMNLDEKTQLAFVDAILSGESYSIVGLKTGSNRTGAADPSTDMGELYQEIIPLEDIANDPDARTWEERRFVARRTRISRARAIREGLYGRDPLNPQPINPHEITTEEAPEVLTRLCPREEHGNRDRATDMSGTSSTPSGGKHNDGTDLLEIWDVYWRDGDRTFLFSLPATNNDEENPAEPAITEGGGKKFLRVTEVICPEQGEIDRLLLFPPLHHMHPASLDSWQKDLAVVAQAVASKIALQVLNTKKTNLYPRGQTDEAVLIRKSQDNAWIASDEPERFKQLDHGGMLGELLPAMGWFSDQANIINQQMNDPQGGTNKTATAAQVLAARAQGVVEHLRQWVQRWATRNMRRMAWYLINDPNMQMPIPYRINGTEYIEIPYGPDVIEGKYDHFAFSIADGTMPYQEPAVQANVTLEFLGGPFQSIVQMVAAGVLKPSAPRIIARQLGITNFDQLVNDMDLDAMRQMQVAMGPMNPNAQQGGAPAQPGMMTTPASQGPFRGPGAGGPASPTRSIDARAGAM